MNTNIIKAIVVEDHKLFRLTLKIAFKTYHPDVEIVGEAEGSAQLFRLLPTTPADIVLLDINLPDVGGADVARRLRREYPALKILVISGECDVATVESMLEAGIDGFISKRHGDTTELANAMHTIVNGYEYFGQDIAAIMYAVYISKKKTSVITDEFSGRERDILQLCSEGLQGKEIAARLGISVNTINSHKKNIFAQLGINNTLEAVRYALKRGIIRIDD